MVLILREYCYAGAILAEHETSYEPGFLLATLPPTPAQRWLALATAAVLLVAFVFTVIAGKTTPLAALSLRLDGFIPTLAALLFVNDTITATLLFAQFSIIRSAAVLVLANGYLFTAFMVVPYALSFPGAFAPTGLLGDGLQNTAWIYVFWHFGFPAAVILYAWPRDIRRTNNALRSSARSAIGWSVAITISIVCGLTWLAVAGEGFLPHFFLDDSHLAPISRYFVILNLFESGLALAMLWRRRHTLLDQWLMVVMLAWISEGAITGLLLTPRYSLGFYAIRIYSLITGTVVLIVLLAETTKLYARLGRSNMMLLRERENKLTNIDAITSSIVHEVRQPLAAITTNGDAGLRWLAKTPPDFDEVRGAFTRMISDTRRASEVLDSIRSLFRRGDHEERAVDVNEVTLASLRVLRDELKDHRVLARVELTPDLPMVMGHRGQLEQVILNLVHNAVEAMNTVNHASRVLRVRTERHDHDEIIVAVEDSGPGIDPKKLDGIFDPFVTTKSHGTGLDWPSRMIIKRHGGRLSAQSSEKIGGALFQFFLPIKSTTTPP